MIGRQHSQRAPRANRKQRSPLRIHPPRLPYHQQCEAQQSVQVSATRSEWLAIQKPRIESSDVICAATGSTSRLVALIDAPAEVSAESMAR